VSKVVKGVIIGAIIGFATGGLGFLAGVSNAATFMAAAQSAAIMGAISGGLSGAAAMFVKKPNMDMGSAIDRQNLSINSQALGKWVFGETPLATDIVYSERLGEDQIVYIVAGAAHEIHSFGDFYVNDEQISFIGNAAQGTYEGALFLFANLGQDPQTPLFIPGSSWDGAGAGVAHIGLKWDLGGDNAEKVEGGIPTRITQVVKGSKVYDPRLDDTRGGSGAHRADDQSTWEWSDNWALIVAHYLLGYRNNGKLVYGVGINPDDVDWLQVATMANVCDETVDGKPRYRVGGIMPTDNDHERAIGQLEASIGGKVSKVGGKYYLWCPHNDLTPVGTITNNNILRESGMVFQPTGDISDLFNTARGRYIDPDTLYQPAPYPEIVEDAAVTEDGRTRLMERDFSIVQDESIAERVTREMVRRSRFSATWTFAVGPEGLLYQPFDVLTLNCDETDFNDQLVRIISMEYGAQGLVVMTVIEEDPSIYDITIPLGTPVTQLDPDSYDPTQVIPVVNLAATPISVTGSGGTVSDAFQVSWDSPGGFVRDTEVRYRVQGEADYSYVQATGFVSAVVTPVEPNTPYEIEARHITVEGVKSPFVSVVATSSDTARGRAIAGVVDYQQINTWRYNPQDDTILPNSTTADAVFRFKRGTFDIATRTVRATIDTATGNITVNENLSTTGEATSVTLSGNGTEAVIVRVLHDASGVEAVGQFQAIETTPADLSQIQDDIDQLEADLNTLNNTTLPNLQNELDQAEQDLATLDGKFPIESTDISPGAIKTPQLDANAVNADKILAGAVTTNKMTANSINGDRITGNTLAADKIVANDITSDRLNVTEILAATPIANEDGVNVTMRSNSQPSQRPDGSSLRVGDIWINTSAGDEPYSWNGSQFIQTYTQIDGGNITTGTVDANRIDVDNLIAKNVRTATSGPRVEIADPSVDPTYALWIGDGAKTNANASIYVRQSGTTEFKGTFIRDLTIGTGALSNGAATLGDVDNVSGTLGTSSSVIASFDLTFPPTPGFQENQGVLIVAAISCIKSGLTEPENCAFVIEADGSIVGTGGCQLIPNELGFVPSRASACVTAFIPNPSGTVSVELFGSSDFGGVTVDGDLASFGGKK